MNLQRNEKILTSISLNYQLNMGLNNIDLPGFVVADLYKTLQIENNIKTSPEKDSDTDKIKTEKQILTDHNVQDWKFLGNNLKNITIITNQKEAVHLPDNELAFLTGILGACKLTLADVAIVNINSNPILSYKDILARLESKIVLLFGVEPIEFGLPISFPYFQLQPFSNVSFLYSPTLIDLEDDKVLKSKLWVCLRRIFGI